MTDEEIFSTGNKSIGLKTLNVEISDDINEIEQSNSQNPVETHKEEIDPANSEKHISSSSEDSESDCEVKLYKTNNTKCLVKEVDEKALHKFYKKKQKERPGQELIDRILNGKSPKINKIFNDPTKAVPLPRKVGTINVKFSERAFPTPARESAQVEEQEVHFTEFHVYSNSTIYSTMIPTLNLILVASKTSRSKTKNWFRHRGPPAGRTGSAMVEG